MIDPVALASEAQRGAADPTASVWVGASAGSGKTKVLTDRVLSLLLNGCAPSRLLCLTFTKAAAAEMANRLAERLASWAVVEQAKLEEELAALLGRPPTPDLRARARRLFALVLDVPGGMKIQTLHAFCQSLLARFPLEAGLTPNMRVLEEREARELLADARHLVLSRAAADRDPALTADLAAVTTHLRETAFAELMEVLVGLRGQFEQLLRGEGGVEAVVARLYRAMEVPPDSDPEALLAEAYGAIGAETHSLETIAAALSAGTAKNTEAAQRLRDWQGLSAERRLAQCGDFESLFLTKEGQVRKNLLTQKSLTAVPEAFPLMEEMANRLQTLRRRVNGAEVGRANAAFLRLGARVLARYAALKAARGALDYDDIIFKARDLLSRRDAAAWVLFKLDGGLDHILIDEAQDTNPDQWHVVKSLTEEFFAGEGSGETPRSIFAVGDAKQSIYSFQRADPAEFEAMRRHFENRVTEARQLWRPVALGVSFRSTAPVLAAVDAVFSQPEAREGVIFGEDRLSHLPVRANQPGLVEIWPVMEADSEEETEAWSPPTARSGMAPARARLARGLARRIHRWTLDPRFAEAEDCRLAAAGRRIKPGDILVLVRPTQCVL